MDLDSDLISGVNAKFDLNLNCILRDGTEINSDQDFIMDILSNSSQVRVQSKSISKKLDLRIKYAAETKRPMSSTSECPRRFPHASDHHSKFKVPDFEIFINSLSILNSIPVQFSFNSLLVSFFTLVQTIFYFHLAMHPFTLFIHLSDLFENMRAAVNGLIPS